MVLLVLLSTTGCQKLLADEEADGIIAGLNQKLDVLCACEDRACAAENSEMIRGEMRATAETIGFITDEQEKQILGLGERLRTCNERIEAEVDSSITEEEVVAQAKKAAATMDKHTQEICGCKDQACADVKRSAWKQDMMGFMKGSSRIENHAIFQEAAKKSGEAVQACMAKIQ